MTEQPEMQSLLSHLSRGESLTEQQAYQAFAHVMEGTATEAQIGALLGILTVRPQADGGVGPSVAEITGAARAMRDHAVTIEPPPGVEVIDTCGTGADEAGTFNISTTAALIAAGAGAHVAKHGNRSVTSSSGSSQILEALGVNLQVKPATLTRCLAEARICFCFAPAHHPAMRHAVGPRKELGFRTIFNLLGPLTNPAGARRQLVGVFDRGLTETLAQVLVNLGSTDVMVVHGDQGPSGRGIDELSTLGPTHVTRTRDGSLVSEELNPEDLGLGRATLEQLQVHSVDESVAVVRSVLEGQEGPAREIAALNGAAALLVAGLASDWAEGLEMACNAIDRGAAQAALDGLVELTNAD